MYIYAPCLGLVPKRGQMRASCSLGLELQIVVSHHVNVYRKSNHRPLATEPSTPASLVSHSLESGSRFPHVKSLNVLFLLSLLKDQTKTTVP